MNQERNIYSPNQSCTPQTPSLVTHKIATPKGHQWRDHPKWPKDKDWSQCTKCRCSKLVVVEEGWGIVIKYFLADGSHAPNGGLGGSHPPECTTANKRCTPGDNVTTLSCKEPTRSPEELVDALQDRTHPASGRPLATRPVKMKITIKQTDGGNEGIWGWRIETEDGMFSGGGYESRKHAMEDALAQWQRYRDGLREENLCPCDTLSRQEAENMADEKAQSILDVPSRHEAFHMLDNGELTGTGAEAEFKRLRHLLS